MKLLKDYIEKLYIKCDYPIIVRQRKNADFLISYPNGEKKYLRKIKIMKTILIK